MGEYTYVAMPCLSTKTSETRENELVDATSPLFYAFLENVGDYTCGMDEMPRKTIM